MYVAVKGGEKAIDNAHRLMGQTRRGDPAVAPLTLQQIEQQMPLAVARVMTEGSLYDPELAALAIKQAAGDLIEAIFLLRAYRTTLPRLAETQPLETTRMTVSRRISATFKDLPGGQVLGPTFDYSHRLLDFALAAEGPDTPPPAAPEGSPPEVADQPMPRVLSLLADEGLIQREPPGDPEARVGDITRQPVDYPAERDVRLQSLARADEGWLLGLAYSSQRGYGNSHPFAGEIRQGTVAVEIVPDELGFAIEIGDITLSECEMINQFNGSKTEPPQFTRGYGLAFGLAERKVMAMALVDRSLRAEELGEDIAAPAQDQEFVLAHADNVEASGFVQHLKLPHYVDFQGELATIRALRREQAEAAAGKDETP
ncbi:carbon-phosphorus lyase complex subunit PhnI [Roseospirillum parvum]|uniref:Alpha-D-ribose 1-methylphosphonate 5-triphosphate synthase subunit PhnI n=1 Tax=Roseospirillum parvum TaxID=83401 RepID=A0A1G8ETC2_9PROT|nr:carbon-phosphorus lyase complex subunit PhnI [Roseospirillum parvum]SDH73116.1 alpha-D-ribose 1-methylphosphonate 5-triphosphate synthase subunit PhnI [Roseospirillum parvum]